MTDSPDEFAWIARLAPLTRGDPRALGLGDDAAVIPTRPGFDLVVSEDAMVEGVHFLHSERPDLIARRLLRTSLSDLAAKAAEPFGYFLMTAWPDDRSWADRDAFIRGLAEDGEGFGIAILGGDTVRTPGPLTLNATVLGWCPSGATVLRSGARAGDAALVLGTIGDGWLGLRAALGEIADPLGRLAVHYRTPTPLLTLREGLRAFARAAADVSDGLVADAGHVARASGLAVSLDLADLPLSADAAGWCAAQGDQAQARLALATGGDDYAIVCAAHPSDVRALGHIAAEQRVPWARVGRFEPGEGVEVTFAGRPVAVATPGWTH
ncbi:MAG TPA: thiamine-phosphate kinase [Caulobacteraceae bacterium]|nr:thiamine-phosphate kinase [Caulobacteraceae bacterium]